MFLGDYWWFFEVFGGSWHLLVVLKVLGCFSGSYVFGWFDVVFGVS